MSDDTKVEKSNTAGALNRLSRKVEEMRNDIDILLNKDKIREQMLEEVLASLAMLKQLQLSTRDHHDNLTQEIKEEIKVAEVKTSDKVEEVKDKIDKKKVIKVVNNDGQGKQLGYQRNRNNVAQTSCLAFKYLF